MTTIADIKTPKSYALEVAVFVCGAVVMIYELVGSRVIAPYVGSSTYVWTSLIGVILASLSAGYYYGGRLADRKPTVGPLAMCIFVSGVIILFTASVKDVLSLFFAVLPIGIEIKTLFLSLVLFAPASFLMGMVSPYAVRLRVDDARTSGSAAGNLYALSTAGSIIGTFSAGFFIIPNFGTTISLFLIGSVLVIISVILGGVAVLKNQKGRTFLVVALAIGGFVAIFPGFDAQPILADVDTEYNRIWVVRGTDSKTDKPVLYLVTDPFGVQAGVFTDGTDDLVFDYGKYYRLVGHFIDNPKSALLIGGSAYTYPRDFLKKYPGAKMDVVEIDPKVTEIAREYFGLGEVKGLNIIHEDGRIFLNREDKKYDVIFMDAFNSAVTVPFHLTTLETVEHIFNMLNGNGVVLMNLISSIDGPKGKFLRAEYATYSAVFPRVYIFPVSDKAKPDAQQNIVMIALKR